MTQDSEVPRARALARAGEARLVSARWYELTRRETADLRRQLREVQKLLGRALVQANQPKNTQAVLTTLRAALAAAEPDLTATPGSDEPVDATQLLANLEAMLVQPFRGQFEVPVAGRELSLHPTRSEAADAFWEALAVVAGERLLDTRSLFKGS